MLNAVHICGRLTAEPELRRTQNGTAVTSFCVAVDSNSKEKNASFINCVAWRNMAEFISKYFAKGKLIIVSGRLQTRSYTTQNGEKRTVTEVVAEQVYFAGDSKKAAENGAGGVATDEFAQLDAYNDELPF